MNAIVSFTGRSLRANRVRTLVTVAGVALAAALLTAVLTSYTSLNAFLYHSEEILSGTWMAMAQCDDALQAEERAETAMEEGALEAYALLQDGGFAQLTKEQQNVYGPYLPIIGVSGDVETLCAIRPISGRMPETPDEVMLFHTWEQHDNVHIGDEISLEVGQREAVAADLEKASQTAQDATPSKDPSDDALPNGASLSIQEGDRLDSSIGYLDAETDGGIFNERLADLQPKTYTVVGFYDSASAATAVSVGMAAFTRDARHEATNAMVYMTMQRMANTSEIEHRAAELFPDASIRLHTGMLRYMGIQTEGAIWSTFFGIVIILATVIVIACISLIYNAFAISVAERVSQFGLLSSIGASRKQLRRAVLLEGMLIACAGVPLGLALGIGGCAVAFWAIGPAIATVFGNVGAPFSLSVEPWALCGAAALSLVTVLVSALIPAWRAGRINIIEVLSGAYRTRISRKGMARSSRSATRELPWSSPGIGGRIFGIPAVVARLDRKRSLAKGTAASISLALAVILLMTAGSLSTFLGTLVEAANRYNSYDIGVVADTVEEKEPIEDEQLSLYGRAYETLGEATDVQGKGWALTNSIPVFIPSTMAGAALEQGDNPSLCARQPDGTFEAMANVILIEGAAFDELARSCGLDPTALAQEGSLQAIAAARVYGNDGNTYSLLELFDAPGTIEAICGGSYEGQPVESFGMEWTSSLSESESGLQAYVGEDDAMQTIPVQEASLDTEPLDILALTDELPAIAGNQGGSIVLVMPLSTSTLNELNIKSPVFSAAFDAKPGTYEETAQALEDTALAFFNGQEPDGPESVDGSQLSFLVVNNYAQEFENNRLLAMVVNVFCLLFTIILALIAMANVFNTVTNSLILRRREFAVMRSIGMSGKQFRAMIIDECAHFGIQGLIPGMILSVGISYLLFAMVNRSLSGSSFVLPWGYVALAIAMTVIAMAISAAFGMHRCKANSIVEALRRDSI